MGTPVVDAGLAAPLQIDDVVELVSVPRGYTTRVLKLGARGTVVVGPAQTEFGWCSVQFHGVKYVALLHPKHLRRVESAAC